MAALPRLRQPFVVGGWEAVHPISWRQEFGGLKIDQVKRLKDLETENTRLRRAVSDLTLDKLMRAPEQFLRAPSVSNSVHRSPKAVWG